MIKPLHDQILQRWSGDSLKKLLAAEPGFRAYLLMREIDMITALRMELRQVAELTPEERAVYFHSIDTPGYRAAFGAITWTGK